jgi:hypothetical protein
VKRKIAINFHCCDNFQKRKALIWCKSWTKPENSTGDQIYSYHNKNNMNNSHHRRRFCRHFYNWGLVFEKHVLRYVLEFWTNIRTFSNEQSFIIAFALMLHHFYKKTAKNGRKNYNSYLHVLKYGLLAKFQLVMSLYIFLLYFFQLRKSKSIPIKWPCRTKQAPSIQKSTYWRNTKNRAHMT